MISGDGHLQTALFGMVSENVVMSFRTRAFRNILMQDAAYFDNPVHAPGKLITRLASDAPNVKAVCLKILSLDLL